MIGVFDSHAAQKIDPYARDETGTLLDDSGCQIRYTVNGNVAGSRQCIMDGMKKEMAK